MATPAKNEEELFNSFAPAMRQVDNMALMFYIAYCIGDYLAFVGLDSAMSEKQTNETASMIIECYPNLQVDALKLFFHNCKRGLYGKHYNRMDGSILLQWFDNFYIDFIRSREEADYQKHLACKEDIAKPVEVQDGEEMATMDEIYAAFHGGKTREQAERDKKVDEIRLRVINANMHLYSELSPEEAEARIEQLVIEEMKKENIITF